jgi:6-phosphogluconolactonase
LSGPNYELLSFARAEALATAAAQQFCAHFAAAADAATVAISGGRIASNLFKSIAQAAPKINHVHFFWADERCVPPDHADSNYRAARELLFEPLGTPDSHIHRIRGEDDPALAAKLASEELARFAPKDPSGLPILDLIFLGMGEDGHVASLFPGAPPQPGIYYPVIGPKPPPERITLSYGIIAAARQVWVLASGQGKEAALRDSLAGGTTPLARVLSERESTRIFCDFRAP